MPLSLDPVTNPILQVYEFFSDVQLAQVDTAEYFGFRKLKLRVITSNRARQLIQLLRKTPHALSYCRLMLDGTRVINFMPHYATEWLDRPTVEQFDDEKLCGECRLALNDLLDHLEAVQAGASWSSEELEQDALKILDRLENCESCRDRFQFDIRVDKDVLINNYLLSDHSRLKRRICSLLWFDVETFKKGFTSFSNLLQFISERRRRPIVLFLYKTEKNYDGDFFKILPLTDSSLRAGELKNKLAEALDSFTVQTLHDYQTVLKRYSSELRPAKRSFLPPSLFLQRKEALAQYPDHPLVTDGPLRGAVVYATMAWLAEKSSLNGEVGHFTLGKGATAFNLRLKFSPTDVQRAEESIFSAETDWRAIIGLVGREIGLSIGSEDLRNHWRTALPKRTVQDFTAADFFSTLKVLHDDFLKNKEKRVELGASDAKLIEILVRLDAERKELKFSLRDLRHLYADVGEIRLSASTSDLRSAELSALARTQLSRILEPDEHNPNILVPSIPRLEVEGVDLWLNFIPEKLQSTYATLRDQDVTIFIISDDPSFPWELVKPFALKTENTSGFEDKWWAVKFSIARWLSGRTPPADRLALNRICCVADQKLPATINERNHLQETGTVCDLPQTFKELTTLLKTNDYDLIHFACHGKFNTGDPGESVALLPDGYRLKPKDLLVPAIIQKFSENRPLVFLNSCHSGRTGNTLIGIEGWASRFIDLKCGAFIGCGWEVNDKLAADFARTFYKRFQEGQTLGKAVQSARGEIMQKAEENSTWLAYYLYGDPNAKMK